MTSQNKGKIIGLLAWVLAGLLGVGLVVSILVAAGHAGRARELGDALAEAATVVGVPDLDATTVRDATSAAEVVQQVREAVDAAARELATTQGERDTARGEAAIAKSEVATLTQRSGEFQAQAETTAAELAAQTQAMAETEATLEQSRTQLEEAQQSAQAEQSRLQQEIENLRSEAEQIRAQWAAEKSSWSQSPEAEVATRSPVELVEAPEFTDFEPAESEPGRLIGSSQMFSLIRHGEDGSLFFQLLDGQTLTYQNVKPETVELLAGSFDRLDMVFRFRIQGVYKCLPPDSVVIRKYWKWHRRHKVRSEVRLVEPEREPQAEPSEE